eukprot:TRINITY_DN81134_c0_g1_i1.p1 TRINITY_DN81134_c0_g1~~TRINITY_DN81134_c0_g1_i1.p1  ORF type:complete len:478 (-),score=84.05 TRINITY_DN81134_c0_g1_i1:66-1499(-)
MLPSSTYARWLPKDMVQVSHIGGAYTVTAYAFMLVIFFCELRSFLAPDFRTVIKMDMKGTDSLQINFDVDVYDIECRNMRIVVFAEDGQTAISTWGEDFWLRNIDKTGKTFGMAMRPDELELGEKPEAEHELSMKKVRQEDGAGEVDSDWSASSDGWKHDNWDHVLKAHDFTFVNFFAGWCSHCQKFAPTWKQTADKINNGARTFPDRDNVERRVQMLKVNCVDFKGHCDKQGIDAYPSLRLYKDDGSFSIYEGARTEDALTKWMEKTVKMKSYGWGKDHETFEKGCNAKGRIQVPRVPGHLELHAGSGDQVLNPRMTNVSHLIKHLSFTDPDDGRYHRKSWSGFPSDVLKHLSPLDDKKFVTKKFHQAYIHDMKIVSTVSPSDLVVYQFSHQSRVKNVPRIQVPQAQFHYDIEPMSIKYKRDSKKWYDFLTSLMAMLGGAFVVMKLLSRMSLATWQSLFGKKFVDSRGGLMIGRDD